MLKRLAILFFVLTVSAQAWAGVCGCFNLEKVSAHSCCKKGKSSVTSVSRKSCCETECGNLINQRVPRKQADTAALAWIDAKPVDLSPERVVWPSQLRVVEAPALATAFVSHRLKYSRPPDLYLRHHSFLI